MIEIDELRAAVDDAFASSSRGIAAWPDPHPDRQPLDEEYSRVTDPARWRIVNARTDAWIDAVVQLGLATIERDVAVGWRDPDGPRAPATEIVRPRVGGGLPVSIARSSIGGVPDAGLVLGVGEPADVLAIVPDCGCDACDSGSAAELDVVDAAWSSVVTGGLRVLRSAAGCIVVTAKGYRASWRPRAQRRRLDVRAVLADPRGWDERTGPSWLDG